MGAHISFLSYVGTDDINALRCRSESGYRNVYYARRNADGVPVYVAKVKVGGVLRALPGARSVDPRVCARAVVRWYADRFGPQWVGVLAQRKTNPFFVTYSRAFGGWRAAVWIDGRREEVTYLRRLPRRRYGPDRWERVPDILAVFPTREAAVRGMRLYLDRLHGLFADVVLYRVGRPALAMAA